MCKIPFWGVLLLFLIIASSLSAQINVTLPELSVGNDEEVLVSIIVDPVDGYDVSAIQFELAYDSNLLSLVDTLLANTLTKQLEFLQVNLSEPGKIALAGFSLTSLGGTDTLLKVLFQSAENSGISPLTFTQFQFNEGNPAAILHNGSIQVGNLNQVNVFLPNASIGSDVDLIVPILVDPLESYNVLSYEFILLYDSNLLTPLDTLLSNTLSEQMFTLLANWSTPDTFLVAGFGINSLGGSDTLIKILFHSTSNSGISPLTFSKFNFNEGSPNVVVHPGTVWVNLAPIPVELSDFQCEFRQGKVFLNWKTISEKDNYGFYIERAICKEHIYKEKIQSWQLIAFIQGNGTSSELNEYEFVDELKNVNESGCYLYYRLKQLDTDGSFTYSPIRSIRLLPIEFELKQNFPNPFNAATRISFTSPFSGNISLYLYNILGQKIATLIEKKSIEIGSHNFEIQMADFPAGIYFYQIDFKGEQNFRQMRKMIYIK